MSEGFGHVGFRTMSWKQRYSFGRRVSRMMFERIDAGAVRTFAASIAYHAIVAAISLIVVVVFLANALGVDVVQARIDRLPDDLREVAEQQAAAIDGVSDGSTVFWGVVGLALASWGMASGFAALYDALNRLYGTHKYRTYTRRYARALGLAVIFSILFFSCAVMLAVGTSIGKGLFDYVGLEFVGTLVALILRLAAMFVFAPITFTLLLRYGSAARPPWRECLAAGVVTGVGWVLLTLGLFASWNLFGTYRAYGSLAIALTVMLYAYLSSYLLLSSTLFATILAEEGQRRATSIAASRAAAARAAAGEAGEDVEAGAAVTEEPGDDDGNKPERPSSLPEPPEPLPPA